MYYQRADRTALKGLTITERKAANKRDKRLLVDNGRSHGVLLYDKDNPIGWVAYGTKTEFPRIDNGRNYKKLAPEAQDNLWRIRCFFVDRDYRKKGSRGLR